MLWKKIYAMSYAKYHKKIFKDTPIDWFLIHKSDGIDGEDAKACEGVSKYAKRDARCGGRVCR